MNSVERLRRLPAFATHRRLATIRVFESFCRPEVFRAIVQVRRLILLLVAHDACPFPNPSKTFPGSPEQPLRTLIAPRDLRFCPCVL